MINPYQKPAMMPANPAPQGLPLQWLQMPGEDEEQGLNQGIGDMASFLKRFKKPPGAAGADPAAAAALAGAI